MNKLLGLLIASTLSFTLINCSDNGDVFESTLTGVLLDSCNGNPTVGHSLELWDAGYTGNIFQEGVDAHLETTAITDENGRFTFKLTEGLSGGYGLITNDEFRMSEGLYGLSQSGDVFDIGEIYTHPFSRNVSYQFQRDNKDWKQGEYVIVRQLGFNSEFINDTLSFSNSTTNGKNLYGTVPLRFPNKLINNNTADTVAFTNRLFYKWHITSNGDDFNDALLSYPCDTTTFSKIVVED